MKAIIRKPTKEQNDLQKLNEERKMKDFQRKLQNVENDFASEYGFEPRTVVYEKFDRDFNRELILNSTVEKNYQLYKDDPDVTKEEIRQFILEEKMDEIEKFLDAISYGFRGQYSPHLPDSVFVFQDVIKENLLEGKDVVKHESLHAAIDDMINGKISLLKVYKNNEFDNEFYANIYFENKFKPLITNKLISVLPETLDQASVLQLFSFEEKFVRYNTLCHMIESELKSYNCSIDNIKKILKSHVDQENYKQQKELGDLDLELNNEKVYLKNFLKEYIRLLKNPVSQLSSEDEFLYSSFSSTSNNNFNFEENDSNVPELIDELLKYAISGNITNDIIKKSISVFSKKYNLKIK